MRLVQMGAPKGQPQAHPDGPLISVDSDERAGLKSLRVKRGMTQEALAEKVMCAPATISNLESGRSTQVRKKVYARIKRALRSAASETQSDETFRKIVDGAIDLDERDQLAVAALIDSLKKPRQSGNS